MQRHFADFLFATGDVILAVRSDGVRYLLSIHMNVPVRSRANIPAYVRSQAAGNAETHETHDGMPVIHLHGGLRGVEKFPGTPYNFGYVRRLANAPLLCMSSHRLPRIESSTRTRRLSSEAL